MIQNAVVNWLGVAKTSARTPFWPVFLFRRTADSVFAVQDPAHCVAEGAGAFLMGDAVGVADGGVLAGLEHVWVPSIMFF